MAAVNLGGKLATRSVTHQWRGDEDALHAAIVVAGMRFSLGQRGVDLELSELFASL